MHESRSPRVIAILRYVGEAARTMADADAYELDYRRAIARLSGKHHRAVIPLIAGISIKLSALHPRYEFAQSQRVMSELLRVKSLALLAKQANIGFTIDAEESQRWSCRWILSNNF